MENNGEEIQQAGAEQQEEGVQMEVGQQQPQQQVQAEQQQEGVQQPHLPQEEPGEAMELQQPEQNENDGQLAEPAAEDQQQQQDDDDGDEDEDQDDDDDGGEQEGEENPSADKNGEEAKEKTEPEPPKPMYIFSEEQMQRVVKCRTYEGDVVEAPWHLLMQSRTFSIMWNALGGDEAFAEDESDSFEFLISEIRTEVFMLVVEWMREHHGQPETVPKDNDCGERIWFILTDWEKNFFEVMVKEFELVKELYIAANFLDLRSLFYYCAQECCRAILDKSAEQIREMLNLPDDLTAEQKEQICLEYGILMSGEEDKADLDADPNQPGTSGIKWPEKKSEEEKTKEPKSEKMPLGNGEIQAIEQETNGPEMKEKRGGKDDDGDSDSGVGSSSLGSSNSLPI